MAHEVGPVVYLINLLYGFKKTLVLQKGKEKKEIDFRLRAQEGLFESSWRELERENKPHTCTRDSYF